MADLDQAPAPEPVSPAVQSLEAQAQASAAQAQTAAPDGPAAAESGTPAAVDTGAAAATPSEGTAAPAPEDTFHDPKDLPPELQARYKGMQRSYTKKMEAIKQDREAAERYRAFERDPHNTIQRVAQQMGYSLNRAGEAPDPAHAADALGDWQPQSWQEVLGKAKEMALAEFRQEQGSQLEPVLTELQGLRKTNIEKLLDDEVPEWREHEDRMQEVLGAHPTLVNDPVQLARLAIPDDVQQSKAMQAALRSLQNKAESGQVSSGSTTRQAKPARPSGPLTFAQSVALAKQQIADGDGAAAA